MISIVTAFLGSRYGIYLAAAVATAAVVWFMVDYIGDIREHKVEERIRELNREAEKSGLSGREAVIACNNTSGMRWDLATGKCVRSVP